MRRKRQNERERERKQKAAVIRQAETTHMAERKPDEILRRKFEDE